MVQLTSSNSEASNIDSGQYTLKIGSSELAQVTDFTIIGDEDWDGTEFSDLFSLTTGKRSKLGQLARAAFKTDDLPKEWDTEDLEGRRVIATIKLNDTGYNSLVPDTITPTKSRKAAPEPPLDEDVWKEDEEGAA